MLEEGTERQTIVLRGPTQTVLRGAWTVPWQTETGRSTRHMKGTLLQTILRGIPRNNYAEIILRNTVPEFLRTLNTSTETFIQ